MIPIDLNGKTALITGGTRGIGRAISLLFAQAGVSTAAVYRSDEEAARVSLQERLAVGGPHWNYRCDVSSASEVASLGARVRQDLGETLDFLILNAGVVVHGTLADTSDDAWRKGIDTNLGSAFFLVREFEPHLNPGGAIVAIASGAGHVGLPGLSVYGAAKAGLIIFCEALAQDLGPRGIRVNVVSPGSTDTSFGIEAVTGSHPSSPSDGNALGRRGVPNDVARAVLFFCSDLSGFVTGQWLRVNGGVV